MSNPEKYTVGWICAVTTEFVAARALFDEKHDQLESIDHQDNNNYALGRIGKHNVVMAALPRSEYGTTTAATVARDMLRSFPNVRFGLMVGIGGGAPSPKHNIRLGDIVVGTRGNGSGGVFQYDYGKAIQDHSFIATGSLNQPPQLLLTAVGALEAEYELEGQQLHDQVEKALKQRPHLRKKYCRPPASSDKLFQSDFVHSDSSRRCTEVCGNNPADLVDRTKWSERSDGPVIHYGLVASANRLMKDAFARDSLAANKDVLCFEMEAAGLMNHFPCIAIRGICDYSDSHKNKEWQGYVAMMAAAYAKELLCQIPPSKAEAEKPIRELFTSIETTGKITRDAVMGMASDHRVAKLERWLSPPDVSTNANLAREQRHPGTGNWLLNSSVFTEWKSGLRQHLWLYGLAGCGKSLLSTTVLDHLLSNSTRPTLVFFFDFNDPRKQKLDSLLRSLAAQLYRTNKDAAKSLDTLFAYHDDGGKQPATTALSTCVDRMVEITGNMAVIVDALDECTTRGELLQWLKTFKFNKAQLIVTGRPEAEFDREIPRFFHERNCVLLDKDAVNADIRSYVEAMLQQRPEFVEKNLSPDLMEMVREKIGNGAEGMQVWPLFHVKRKITSKIRYRFRWAACQLDSLARCLSPRDIKTALGHLPRDLNETYSRMLESIPLERKPSAIRLLQFLVHTLEPLTVPEAIEVIATQVDQEPRGFSVDGRLCQGRDVLQYCPSLVVIVKAKRFWRVVEELHLSHFSVKEYLLEHPLFDPESSYTAMTTICLTYLRDIDGDLDFMVENFPMVEHAVERWIDYTLEVENNEENVRTTVQALLNDTIMERFRHFWGDNGVCGDPESKALYYACDLQLAAAARYLINKGANINAQGGIYGNALQAASIAGSLEIVQLLLSKGAEVNAQGGPYANALRAAEYGRNREIEKLLLENGANDIKDRK